MPEVAQLEGRVFDTITAVDAGAWDACFPGALEDHGYHLAVEAAGLAGFRYLYIGVFDGPRLVGAAPAFITAYDLETTLDQPGLRRGIRSLKRACPWLLRVRLAALGSPCSEVAMLGIADAARAPAIADVVVRTFEAAARARGGALLAVKDLAAADEALWRPRLEARGFTLIAGLPVAALPVDFADIDQYLTQLSHATRKDMRRKLRQAESLRYEAVTTLLPYRHRLMALYRSTLERAEMTLEELTFDYFENVLAHMPGRAFCGLYFDGDDLVAANLMLCDGTTLIDKYFMMAPEGRRHNLYFVSWFNSLQLCLGRGVKRFQAGQAAYANKLRLGAGLSATWMAFKHRNGLVSAALRALSPWFAADAVTDAAHD